MCAVCARTHLESPNFTCRKARLAFQTMGMGAPSKLRPSEHASEVGCCAVGCRRAPTSGCGVKGRAGRVFAAQLQTRRSHQRPLDARSASHRDDVSRPRLLAAHAMQAKPQPRFGEAQRAGAMPALLSMRGASRAKSCPRRGSAEPRGRLRPEEAAPQSRVAAPLAASAHWTRARRSLRIAVQTCAPRPAKEPAR